MRKSDYGIDPPMILAFGRRKQLLRVVDASIVRPNRITLTNNGKTLIVDDTVGETIFAFDVQAGWQHKE
jgi:sugar lactone lactonase YvrE